jgi:hypothetical protein
VCVSLHNKAQLMNALNQPAADVCADDGSFSVLIQLCVRTTLGRALKLLKHVKWRVKLGASRGCDMILITGMKRVEKRDEKTWI